MLVRVAVSDIMGGGGDSFTFVYVFLSACLFNKWVFPYSISGPYLAVNHVYYGSIVLICIPFLLVLYIYNHMLL